MNKPHSRERRLQRRAADLQRTLAKLCSDQEQERTREHVLLDLCQLLDSLRHLKETHEYCCQTASAATCSDIAQPVPASCSTAQNPSGYSPDSSLQTWSPACGHKLQHVVQAECLQQQHVAPCQTNSQGPDVVQAASCAVPAYCCTADLLFKAPPELVDLALSLRAPDISRLLTNTFCELAALLELVSRSQEPGWIDPDDPAQPAPAAGVLGAAELPHAASRGSSRSPSASSGSGGAPTEPLSGSQPPHPQHMAELQDVVDRFYGVLTIIFALQPVPLVEAACLNHRTQEQVAPPKQHWQAVLRRLQLTPSQAAYLDIALAQVQSIRRSAWSQLGTLLQEAASPNLLIVTAQQQQQRLQHLQLQQQQQQQSPNHATQQQQAGSSVSGSQGGSADTWDFAAAASGQPSKESQLSSRVSHMATYGALVGWLVADTLTTTQKAVWMVSSYPWILAPVILCNSASQMRQQQAAHDLHNEAAVILCNSASQMRQQQAAHDLHNEAAGPQQAEVWPGSNADRDQASVQQHLQQRRYKWLQQQGVQQEGALAMQQLQALLAGRDLAAVQVDVFGTLLGNNARGAAGSEPTHAEGKSACCSCCWTQP